MTKEQFDNQKWYKNMPVWANGQKCYVREVRFMTGEINVIYKIGATSGVTWDFCLVETSPPEPTALDLIAAEREKQISKGYTVEHDAKYVGETYIHFDQLAFGLMNRVYAPDGWDKKYWEELTKLPLKEKLAIAGAWIATELDIILHKEKTEQ